jgi:hypothetical protein
MYNNIRYLGVDIGPEGISVPKEITRTLDRLETMRVTSSKHVQKILGFFNYWRAHIPNLAQRTFHLRQLIKKDVHPFQFSEECQKERVDVIGSLRSPNILQPIRSDEAVYLFVDSSYKGVGLSAAQAEHPPNDPQAVQKNWFTLRKGQPRLKPCMHICHGQLVLLSANKFNRTRIMGTSTRTPRIRPFSYRKTNQCHFR